MYKRKFLLADYSVYSSDVQSCSSTSSAHVSAHPVTCV